MSFEQGRMKRGLCMRKQREADSLLRTYLKPHWFNVSLLALLLFGSLGFEILGPQLLGHFIDAIQSSMRVLLPLALLFISLAIANQFVTALASYMSEDIFQHDAMRLLEGNVGARVIARESANHSRGAGKVPVELACQYS